jgi:hypothetical protein
VIAFREVDGEQCVVDIVHDRKQLLSTCEVAAA